MHHLTVIHPFGDHKRGDRITEDEAVKAILGGENAHHCNKTHPVDEQAEVK